MGVPLDRGLTRNKVFGWEVPGFGQTPERTPLILKRSLDRPSLLRAFVEAEVHGARVNSYMTNAIAKPLARAITDGNRAVSVVDVFMTR